MAALAVLAAACSNEDDSIQPGSETGVKMITETVTATNGDASGSASTRADVAADASFTWTAGDLVAVHVSDGKYYTTTALAVGGSNTAEFSVTYPAGQSRDAFAVFPASIVAESAANYGQSGTALGVTLPGTYTLAEVSGTTTPCPMIADNMGDSWNFKQLCGMLRLTVNNIPVSATYLTIDFNGKKVQGAFSIASEVTPATSVIATSATDGTDDIITVTGLTGAATTYDINLPLPTGDYTDVTVTAYNSSNLALLTITSPMKSSGTYTAARAMGRKVTATLPVFTVKNDGTKVAFAPSNLQYNDGADTYKWRFAEHQYDYVGAWDTSTWVDLFGWGTWTGDTPNPLLTDNPGTYAWNDADFTKESLLVDASQRGYDWRTLSQEEWMWLLGPTNTATANPGENCRRSSTIDSYANARFIKAKVETVAGVIIFPDTFVYPAGVTKRSYYINHAEYQYNYSLNADEWTKMEAAGAVFLPAAGYRGTTTMYVVGSEGYYWSSTLDPLAKAYNIKTTQNSLVPSEMNNKYLGCSVRLVRTVE